MAHNSTDSITQEILETLEKLSSAPSNYALMRELVHKFLLVGRNDDALYYLNILIENYNLIDETSFIDLSKGKNSLGEMTEKLNRLIND